MKIIRLSCENIKKVRAVEITPTGELVEITGKNGAGKTSVLDAIWWALAGTTPIQEIPIRTGAEKARVRLDLGELIVERRFTAHGSTLTVENADGLRYTSPQGVLDALLGALTFDPLVFANQKAPAQYDMLRGLVTLDADVATLDALNRRDFARRTELGREARARHAQAAGLTVPPDLPTEAIDTAALMDRMASAARVNTDIEMRRGRREQVARRASELHAEAVRLEAEATGLEQELRAAAPLPRPIDLDAIRIALETAEGVNRGIDQRTARDALVAQAEELDGQIQELTAAIESRTRAKAEAIAQATMPVPGLGFGNGVVLYNGLPFDQASHAEQLRVSVAIAMAANPTLRVLRIEEGSLLDQDNVALIAEMARAHDYQVWLETVNASGRPAVVIEDGTVQVR